MRRLFTAAKIDSDQKLNMALESFANELSTENIKWVNPKNIHITLKFFANTPEKNLKPIIKSLSDASQKSNPFDIILKGCGTFGSPRFPRVIWFGLGNNTALKNLYENINDELAKIGYKADKRGFFPHLTIGRVKHIKDLYTLDAIISKYAEEEFITQKINEFNLFESILQKEGPKYNIIESFKL